MSGCCEHVLRTKRKPHGLAPLCFVYLPAYPSICLCVCVVCSKSFSSLVGRQWPRCAGIGGAAGIALTVPMMYGKMKTIDLDGLEDRCARLRAVCS